MNIYKEIERCIHTIKERTHATWNTLPLKEIPTRIIIEMITGSAMWINMLPPAYGIFTRIKPRTLVAGLQINYKKLFPN